MWLGLGAMLASVCGPAQAQAIGDRFWFNAAAFYAGVDSSMQVTRPGGTEGTEIDLEGDLGLDNNEFLPALTAGWHVSDSIVLTGEYYLLKRNSERVLDREIIFDEVVYPVSGTVEAGFDTDIYRFTVGWSFVRKEDIEFGAALGLHMTQFDLFLEGSGSLNGSPGEFVRRQRDVLAPLPTLGIYGLWEPAPRVTIGGRVDYLSLSIDDYDGRLVNSQITASYRVTKNIGVGVQYRYVNYRVDVEKSDWEGSLKYEFNGPALFLEVGF